MESAMATSLRCDRTRMWQLTSAKMVTCQVGAREEGGTTDISSRPAACLTAKVAVERDWRAANAQHQVAQPTEFAGAR